MSDCLFCKIAKKEIPSQVVYEDKDVLAFKDIHPQAPVHILVIPKKHFGTLNDLSDISIMNPVFSAVQKIVKEQGIDQKGYRTVINCNKDGGQTVYHLHLHILGGRQLGGGMAGL